MDLKYLSDTDTGELSVGSSGELTLASKKHLKLQLNNKQS